MTIKKLVAIGFLAAIPIGFSVAALVGGGIRGFLVFWAILVGACILTIGAVWAIETLGDSS